MAHFITRERGMGILVAVMSIAFALIQDLGAAAFYAEPVSIHHLTNGMPAGWRPWSPRDEIAPEFGVDKEVGHSTPGALRVSVGRRAGAFGAWRTRIAGVKPGQVYRFSAFYRVAHIEHERRSVIARLEWRNTAGQSLRPPEYALDAARDGEWTQVEYVCAAPEKAEELEVQLGLGFSQAGIVWWDDIQLAEEANPPDRVVRAVTLKLRPRQMKSATEAVEQFCRLAEKSAGEKPDVICMPEGITVVGTGKTYAEVSESIPGPTTRRLGDLARKLNAYVVAGIYERVDALVYNTAVLIGRDGALVGTYRKTHLPREEWEAGITPGDEYPVFRTDFGTVGLMICWDLQFPEVARALALKGAEVILLPIWGGSDVLAQARSIENHVFLISSSYDMRTFIVDPTGKILVEAKEDPSFVSADLHLDRILYQPWLGNMKTRTWKERRPDLSGALGEPGKHGLP